MNRSPLHGPVAWTVPLLYRAVSARHPGMVLASCAIDVVSRTPGENALGGVRRSRAAYRAWFGRLMRLTTALELRADRIDVSGPAQDTRVLVHWHDTVTVADRSRFVNHGTQTVRMRWGRIVSIDYDWDLGVIEQVCAHLAELGVAEALADPITT